MEQTLFGTDGIRARVGHFPLDADSLSTLGDAIAQWAQKKYSSQPTVLIGHDTRESCGFIKSTIKSRFLLHSIDVHDGGVLPTPAVFNIINNDNHFDFGIVISASHNPYHDNGIKLFDAKSGKLKPEDEKKIFELFYQQQKKSLSLNADPKLEAEFLTTAGSDYVLNIRTYFEHNFLKNKKIVLDCAHGATFAVAPIIFREMGARITPIFCEPNGKNINDNCGSTNPENLKQKVLQEKADIGFAFDGDGDRLTVVTKNGEIKNGDDILAFLSTHPKYQKEKTVVGTIMTNCGMEAWLQNQGKRLIRTQVGDKHVAHALEKENLLLGAEQSGHVILRDYLNCGDGIFAALRVAETAQLTNNWDLKTFEKYPQALSNIVVSEKKDLTLKPLSEIIAHTEERLTSGRIIVRYSGTEPKLRVMVEEATQENANAICTQLTKKLQKELS